MKMVYRYTMKELTEWSDYELLKRIIQDRQESTTNVYSPLNQRLNELHRKLENKERLSRWAR